MAGTDGTKRLGMISISDITFVDSFQNRSHKGAGVDSFPYPTCPTQAAPASTIDKICSKIDHLYLNASSHKNRINEVTVDT